MPLLGIFSKKNKASRRGDVTKGSPSINSVNSELESALSSPTSEYIHTDRSLPSSPNGRDHLHPRDAARNMYPSPGASSSKLRLPFSRKRMAAASSSTVDNLSDYAARPGYLGRLSSGAMSDAEADPRHLEPPPNKRSVFAAYGDPHSALSTRSLPDTPHSGSSSPKRPFFNWSKSQNSTPAKSVLQKARPAASSPLSPQLDAESSFNLKAFRHVRPPSPAHSTASAASLQPPTVPVARPRNVSTASDSSQRISVAAFREAQARRSAAGSPVPSFRSISPGPQLDQGRGRPNVPHSPRQQPPHARIASRSVSRNPLDGRRLSSLVYDSDSDESASSSEADSEDDQATKSILGRRRTLTQQKKAAAHGGGKSRATKSEIGHGSASTSQLHSRPPRLPPPPRISTMPVSSPDVRKRASLSTSAVSPSAPAQRASLIANSSLGPDSSRQSRHIREASSVSNPPATVRRSIVVSQDSDSSDSEDDAPLASLIPPRRPGSSLSHQSNRSQSSTRAAKPLIDISTLTGPNRRPLESGPNSSAPSPAFTPGKTLVSSPVSMTPPTPPITSTSPPTRFVSPPGSPVKAARTLSTEPSPVVPQRTIPVRKGTAESALREGLNERLGKVMMSSASSAASSSSATSSSVTRGTASSSRVQTTPTLRADSPTPSANLQSTVRQIGHRRTSSDNPSMRTRSTDDNMDELVRMLGGGIRLISKNGEEQGEGEDEEGEKLTKKVFPGKKKSFPGKKVEDGETTEDESEEEDSDDETEGRGKRKGSASPTESISPPIPILRRTPVPSFSVTSRPQQHKGTLSVSGLDQPRQRTSTFIPPSPTTSSSDLPAKSTPLVKASPPVKASLPAKTTLPAKTIPSPRAVPSKITTTASVPVPNAPKSATLNPTTTTSNNSRQRSSSMMPLMTIPASPKVAMFPVPTKPFATPRDSPASSTGDSSSGRAPFTPRDGSDIASGSTSNSGREPKGEQWSGGASGLGLGPKGHAKRRSVSFEEDPAVPIKGKNKPENDETRRRDRRRDEAKAAIELGNVINGRGPIVDDDEDDTPINQITSARMNTVGPMMAGPMPMQMGFGGPAPGWNGWPQMPMNPQMLSPTQFMGPMPPPGDPAFFAAHQQAMMYAKQAYQMAVAQQAMAAAGDEWERTSAIGGSVYGGGAPSMYGMGGGWSSAGSMIFPSSQSMYGGGARSEYGGGGGGGGRWSSSQSVYGESFGDRRKRGTGGRDSGYAPPVPPVPQRSSVVGGGGGGGGRGVSNPRTRTVSQPANPVKPSSGSNSPRRAPPSSWKAGV